MDDQAATTLSPVYIPSSDSVLAPVPDPKTIHVIKFKNQELLRAKASPFLGFFPDELVVQEKTVSLSKKEFLSTCCESFPLKDIGRVILTDTIFFSSLILIGKNTAHQLEIAKLSKEKAKEAKDLIEGLMMEEKDQVELPSYLATPAEVHTGIFEEPTHTVDPLLDPGHILEKYSHHWS